jgi:hypothetical protein
MYFVKAMPFFKKHNTFIPGPWLSYSPAHDKLDKLSLAMSLAKFSLVITWHGHV